MWRSTGASNQQLIDNLRNNQVFSSQRVYDAMLRVDRANFCRNKDAAYEDSPQSIGHGQTISAPHMHAHAAQQLEPYLQPGAHVLDVGCGSGYLVQVLSNMVLPGGKVVGIELVDQLAAIARSNIAKSPDGKQRLDNGDILIVAGDGKEGYRQQGPYDCIHVGAGASVMPQELIRQLKSPGELFIPVGASGSQRIIHVLKDAEGNITQKQGLSVMYVPLL